MHVGFRWLRGSGLTICLCTKGICVARCMNLLMDGWMDEERRTIFIMADNINCSPHMRMRAQSRQSREEHKTSHHHRTNKRAQSEHKQVHAACKTNTICAISKSLIQSHAAIENRHANNMPGIKVARTRFFCFAQCAPSQPCDLTFGMFLSVPIQHA